MDDWNNNNNYSDNLDNFDLKDNNDVDDDYESSRGIEVDKVLFDKLDTDFETEYGMENGCNGRRIFTGRFMDDSNLFISPGENEGEEDDVQEAEEFEGFKGHGRMKILSGEVISQSDSNGMKVANGVQVNEVGVNCEKVSPSLTLLVRKLCTIAHSNFTSV